RFAPLARRQDPRRCRRGKQHDYRAVGRGYRPETPFLEGTRSVRMVLRIRPRQQDIDYGRRGQNNPPLERRDGEARTRGYRTSQRVEPGEAVGRRQTPDYLGHDESRDGWRWRLLPLGQPPPRLGGGERQGSPPIAHADQARIQRTPSGLQQPA